MNTDQIAFLMTPEGQRALEQAALLPNDRLTRLQRLRRNWPAPIATGIVELLELRHRARNKFDYAAQMFFTPEGLEQSTGDVISAYRATRFPLDVPIFDACCGIGGDALALRRRAPVLAADANPAAAACVRANAAVLPAPDAFPLHALCADVTTLDLTRLSDRGIQSAFFDPSRRVSTTHGRRRARDPEDYLPPLSWTAALREHFPNIGVKVSPAIEDEVLRQMAQEGGVVEFLSDQGECKEAVVWYGRPAHDLPLGPRWQKPNEYIAATVLRPGEPPATLVAHTREGLPPAAPRAWLYEPNAAVIRAHLVPTLTDLLSLAPLDVSSVYLTGENPIATPLPAPIAFWTGCRSTGRI